MNVEHAAVAVSVDALAQQAARHGADEGAAFVVDHEIAGRVRGGVEWRADDPIAIAVVARPMALDPASGHVAWLAASLGALGGLHASGCADGHLRWPDVVLIERRRDVRVVTAATVLLDRGRVDSAILVARVDPVGSLAVDRAAVLDAFVASLRSEALSLVEPVDLVQRYRRRCETIGRHVRIELLPAGTVRGRADELAHDGSLIVSTPTGLVEHVPIANARVVTMDDG